MFYWLKLHLGLLDVLGICSRRRRVGEHFDGVLGANGDEEFSEPVAVDVSNSDSTDYLPGSIVSNRLDVVRPIVAVLRLGT